MYCVKCGVELSEGQLVCPICATKVSHPDFPVDTSKAPYPVKEFKSDVISRRGLIFVISILMLIPMFMPMIFEITWQSKVTWSGYVTGGVLLFYIMFILPFWFNNPNPVIFTPCAFLAIALYVLYICLATGGKWYLNFAFPIIAVFAAIVITMVTLLRYLRHGRLYVFGGGLIAMGFWTVLIELMLSVAFNISTSVNWSLFSFCSLFVIGLLLILIAIIKPFKEAMRKIFYI